jgi:hypothetical protein
VTHELGQQDRYWEASRRPLVSLAFVFPLLVVYEGGLLIQGVDAPRNGVDVWLRTLLDYVGFGQYFLLPLLTCGALLGWHYVRREPWSMRRGTLGRMAIESLGYGWLLLVAAGIVGTALASAAVGSSHPTMGSTNPSAVWGEIAGYCGAGIYEELLFRLLMLPALIASLRLAHVPHSGAVVLGVALTSLLFALAHYQFDWQVGSWHWQSAGGDRWELSSFLFRWLASVVFCTLFLLRGFGITAGTHACYDVLTVVLP